MRLLVVASLVLISLWYTLILSLVDHLWYVSIYVVRWWMTTQTNVVQVHDFMKTMWPQAYE